MMQPGRQYNSGDARYGFNGHEKDDEISGSGNSTSSEFWQYDTRLGRRWNLDPVIVPRQSSYSCFNNSPVKFIDRLGLHGEDVIDKKWDSQKGQYIETGRKVERNGSDTYNYTGGGLDGQKQVYSHASGKSEWTKKESAWDASFDKTTGNYRIFQGYVRLYSEANAGIGVGAAKSDRLSGLGYEINIDKRTVVGAKVNTEDIADEYDKLHGTQDPIEKIAKSVGNGIKPIVLGTSERELGGYYGAALVGGGYSSKFASLNSPEKGRTEQTIKITTAEFYLLEINLKDDGSFKNVFLGVDLSFMQALYVFKEAELKGGIKVGEK